MIRAWIAVLLGAVLFTIFAFVRVSSCNGHCAGCAGNSCVRRSEREDHVR